MTIGANPSLDDTARRRAVQSPAATGLRAWLSRLTEPQILYPGATILALGMIWGGTLNLVRVERADAATASAAATLELVETYEAQVVRALREIDQTLKFVKYVCESKGASAALSGATYTLCVYSHVCTQHIASCFCNAGHCGR